MLGARRLTLPDSPPLGMAAPRGPAEGAGLGGHALDVVWVPDLRVASPVNSSGFPRSISQPLDPPCAGPCGLSHHFLSFPLTSSMPAPQASLLFMHASPFPPHSFFHFLLPLPECSSAMYLHILLFHSNLCSNAPPPSHQALLPVNRQHFLFLFMLLPCSVFLCNLSLLA